MKLVLFVLTSLLLSSCLVNHTGGISSGPLLNIKDQYVDMVSGKSKSVFIFGFGNLKNDQLILNARKNMYLNRRLALNEYYSNLTTDISRKYIFFPFIQITKVAVSADVIKTNDSIDSRFGHDFNKIITPFVELKNNASEKIKAESLRNGDELVNGDSVFYSMNSKNCPLYIVSNLDKESVILLSTDLKHKNILVPLNKNTFFIKNSSQGGYKNGSKVAVETFDLYEGKPIKMIGVVFGFSKSYALIKIEDQFYIHPVDKLQKTD
jgi:hypothetical protein